MKSNAFLAVLAPVVLVSGISVAQAAPIYLNHANMTVALGASHAADPEPFADHTTAHALANIIDAPSASAGESHASGGGGTHVWISDGTPLELDFDLLVEYDLTTLHFWNYYTETYDVDEINFTFYSGAHSVVGTLQFFPETGTSSPETSQDYALSFPDRVRYVNAVLTGTNGHIDFNNIGFTGELSTPVDPSPVPLPASALLLGAGVGALALKRKRRT